MDEENIIIDDLSVSVVDGGVQHNLEKLQEQLKEQIEPYKELKIKDESLVPEAKQTRSNLNKIYKLVNEEKKRVKKEIMAPYTEFEKEVKKMFSELKEAIDNIDTQIKEYEDLERLEKWNEIEEYINSFDIEMPNLANIIYNPKWLNKTFTMKKCKEDVDKRIEQFERNFNNLEPENAWGRGKSEYVNLLENLGDKEREEIDFQAIAEKAEERIQEEDRKYAEHFDKTIKEDNTIVLKLKNVTDDEYELITEFLDDINIEYERSK